MAEQGVHLRVVDRGNVLAAIKLEMEPGQESFVSPVVESLAEAYVEHEFAWPRLVYDGDDVVGFVMARFDPARDYGYLWRLNIAAGQQRQGYGRFAVREVMRETKRRGLNVLLVSYVPEDGGPQGFYEGLGFTPTGRIDDGEVEMRLPLDEVDT